MTELHIFYCMEIQSVCIVICIFTSVSQKTEFLSLLQSQDMVSLCLRSGCCVVRLQPSQHCYSLIFLSLLLQTTPPHHTLSFAHANTHIFIPLLPFLVNFFQLVRAACKLNRHIHCSHPSHVLVSQIIISECSTLIHAVPCFH